MKFLELYNNNEIIKFSNLCRNYEEKCKSIALGECNESRHGNASKRTKKLRNHTTREVGEGRELNDNL